MAKTLISDPIWGQQNFSHGFNLYWYLEHVPSYHPMQFPGAPMTQTSKNDKKPNFGPDFGPFGLNLGPQLFCGFCFYQ